MSTLHTRDKGKDLWEETACTIVKLTDDAALIEASERYEFIFWVPLSLIENDSEEIYVDADIDLIIPLWKAKQIGLI